MCRRCQGFGCVLMLYQILEAFYNNYSQFSFFIIIHLQPLPFCDCIEMYCTLWPKCVNVGVKNKEFEIQYLAEFSLKYIFNYWLSFL